MKITLRTEVNSDWKTIREGFNESLFLKLNPPFPKVKILRFDGSQKGDVVSMELNFLVWKDKWTSDITDSNEFENGFDFIDEGNPAAFPFKKWRHHHIVDSSQGKSIITDAINFSTGFLLTDTLLYPFLYLQFLYRKPVYKRVFSS